MSQGKGSLSKLEKLKAEHGPRFKAEAPKYRQINQKCFDLLCPYAIGRVGMGRDGRLHAAEAMCKRKRCPREAE